SAWITVTGTDSPASLKTRVMPALRPTRPGVLAALIVFPLVERRSLRTDALSALTGCDWPGAVSIQFFSMPGGSKARAAILPTAFDEYPDQVTGEFGGASRRTCCAARAVPRQ